MDQKMDQKVDQKMDQKVDQEICGFQVKMRGILCLSTAAYLKKNIRKKERLSLIAEIAAVAAAQK